MVEKRLVLDILLRETETELVSETEWVRAESETEWELEQQDREGSQAIKLTSTIFWPRKKQNYLGDIFMS